LPAGMSVCQHVTRPGRGEEKKKEKKAKILSFQAREGKRKKKKKGGTIQPRYPRGVTRARPLFIKGP